MKEESYKSGNMTIINTKYNIASADKEIVIAQTDQLFYENKRTFADRLLRISPEKDISLVKNEPRDKTKSRSLIKLERRAMQAFGGSANNVIRHNYKSWNAYYRATQGKGALLKYK